MCSSDLIIFFGLGDPTVEPRGDTPIGTACDVETLCCSNTADTAELTGCTGVIEPPAVTFVLDET